MSFGEEPLPPLVDVRRLLRTSLAIVLAGRWTIAGFAVLAFACAVLGMRLIEPRYTATLVVGPTSDTGITAMGARLPTPTSGVFGSLGEQGEERMSDFERFIYLATSIAVAEELAGSPDLMRKVFEKMWDEGAQRWRPDAGPGARLRRLLAALAGRVAWVEPDGRALARYLQSELQIERVGITALRRISFRHADPEFAKLLLTRTYHIADGILRDEAARRIGLLTEHATHRISGQPKGEHTRVLVDLLRGYERTAMMIDVHLPFAADLVQPAMTGVLPDTPDPATVLPVAAALGLALGCAVVFTRAAWRGSGAVLP